MKAQTVFLTVTTFEEFIAFIPVIFYCLILILIFWKLRKDKVTLKELLLDKDIIVEVEEQKAKQEQETAKAVAKLDPVATEAYLNRLKTDTTDSSEEEEKPKHPRSTSRLLALISGLISVGIACSITTFYMWMYFECKNCTTQPKIELDELLTVLLSLGIGVIPYAFNKVGNALKN